MGDTDAMLGELARQRATLASRIRLPWWYVALFGVATAALLSAPVVVQRVSDTAGTWGLLWPAILVYLLSDRLLGPATGVRLSRGTLRAYPSSRTAGIAMLLVVVGGTIGVYLLLAADMLPQALVVIVVATVAAVRCLVSQTAAIRRDVQDGRVVAG
jgi:hypothetical protein